MPSVTLKNNEPFEVMLKRFKKKIERAAIPSEIRKHQRYEKPSDAKRRMVNSAKRKALKMARKMAKMRKK